MKKEELEEEMKRALENAKELLLKSGRILPVAFIYSENGVGIIGFPFKNRIEKEIQVSNLIELVEIENANAIFFIIESWYVVSDKKDLDIEPSKHPMKKECILLFGECEDGNITMMQKFEREKDEIIFGEEIDIDSLGFSRFSFGISDKEKGRRKSEKSRHLN